MSADAIHQVISKNLKRRGIVEDFADYVDATADAGVQCVVMEPGKNMVEVEDGVSRHALKVLADQGLRPYIAQSSKRFRSNGALTSCSQKHP